MRVTARYRGVPRYTPISCITNGGQIPPFYPPPGGCFAPPAPQSEERLNREGPPEGRAVGH